MTVSWATSSSSMMAWVISRPCMVPYEATPTNGIITALWWLLFVLYYFCFWFCCCNCNCANRCCSASSWLPADSPGACKKRMVWSLIRECAANVGIINTMLYYTATANRLREGVGQNWTCCTGLCISYRFINRPVATSKIRTRWSSQAVAKYCPLGLIDRLRTVAVWPLYSNDNRYGYGRRSLRSGSYGSSLEGSSITRRVRCARGKKAKSRQRWYRSWIVWW